MLQLDGNTDVYKMECSKMLKYNIIYGAFTSIVVHPSVYFVLLMFLQVFIIDGQMNTISLLCIHLIHFV
jgi:hypothetical protein